MTYFSIGIKGLSPEKGGKNIVELEKLTDIRGAGKWAMLSAVYLILALWFLWGRWELSYAIPYVLGFAAIAIVLSAEDDEPGLIASLCAALIGLASVAISEPIGGLQSSSAAWISGVLFVGLLLNEFKVVEVGGHQKVARYLLLVSFLAWFFWALNYFISRLVYWSGLTGLPLETVLNHGGIMLLALNEALALLGIEYKNQNVVSVVFALVAILGAFLLVSQLGWGLHLLPP